MEKTNSRSSCRSRTKEKHLEKRCQSAVREAGGFFIKLLPFVEVGLPDRLLLLPGGVVWFVELKSATGRLGPKQAFWQRRLRKLGMNYLCTSDFDEFCRLIDRAGKTHDHDV